MRTHTYYVFLRMHVYIYTHVCVSLWSFGFLVFVRLVFVQGAWRAAVTPGVQGMWVAGFSKRL